MFGKSFNFALNLRWCSFRMAASMHGFGAPRSQCQQFYFGYV